LLCSIAFFSFIHALLQFSECQRTSSQHEPQSICFHTALRSPGHLQGAPHSLECWRVPEPEWAASARGPGGPLCPASCRVARPPPTPGGSRGQGAPRERGGGGSQRAPLAWPPRSSLCIRYPPHPSVLPYRLGVGQPPQHWQWILATSTQRLLGARHHHGIVNATRR
jgi:hypothetical protein